MSDLLTTSIPQYAVPIVDSNGCITRPWLYFLLGLKSQASVIVDIIGITDIAPKSLVANSGTTAGVPSSLAISNDFSITNGSTPELEINPTIARTDETLALNGTGTQTVEGQVNFSGELFAEKGLFITPPVGVNWVGGGNINQSNPQPSSLNSGIHLGGSVAGGAFANYHEMLIVDFVNVGTAYSMNGFTFSHDVNNGGGTSVTGGRQGFTTNLSVQCPTGNLGGAVYTGLSSFAIVTGNDNGSPSSLNGAVFGFNPVMNLQPQGTLAAYWAAAVGTELDFAVASGVTVDVNYGFHICTQAAHASNGGLDDIAFHISGSVGQTAFWKYGVGFGANVKPTAFGPSSTLIKVFPDTSSGTLTVENFIDLTPASVTVTGNTLIAQGATITGQGAATFAAFNLPTVSTAPTTVPANGQVVFNTASKKINVGAGGSWYSSAALTLGAG